MTSCNCRHHGRGEGKGFCLKIPKYKEALEPYEIDIPKYDGKGNYEGTEKLTLYHTVTKLYWKCTCCGREFPNLSDFKDKKNDDWNWRYPLRLGKNCSC